LQIKSYDFSPLQGVGGKTIGGKTTKQQPRSINAPHNWKKHAVIDTNQTEEIILFAKQLKNLGIKSKDALHVACATKSGCNYFITTDMNLLKKLRNFEKIKTVNPIDFINHLENL